MKVYKQVLKISVVGFCCVLTACVTTDQLSKYTVQYFKPVDEIPDGKAVIYLYSVDSYKYGFRIRAITPIVYYRRRGIKIKMKHLKLPMIYPNYYYPIFINPGVTQIKAKRHTRAGQQGFPVFELMRVAMYRRHKVSIKAKTGEVYFVKGVVNGGRMSLFVVDNDKAISEISKTKLYQGKAY